MITKIFNISRPFHYIIFLLCLILIYFYNRIYSFGNFRETEIFLTLPTQLPREIRPIQGDLIYADKVRLLDDDDLKW